MLSDLLDAALNAVGGNQAELARRVNRSETTVSRWRSGSVKPDYESCLRLARIVGGSPQVWLEAAGLDPELMPGEVAVQSELDVRLARLGATLSSYPRAVWIAVLEANERMADALASNQPPVSECPKDGVSASDGTQKLGKHDLDPPLTALKGRLAPAFA
jgi:transcriptional regulator with XRE-family HTH domain